MEKIPDTYKFIIVFSDPRQQKDFLKIMDDIDIPEEFSEQINKDIEANKCDKKDLVSYLEDDIYSKTWDKYYGIYEEKVHTRVMNKKITEETKHQLEYEMRRIPKLGYYSVVEYTNDDFCYEILKQLMPELSFIHYLITSE